MKKLALVLILAAFTAGIYSASAFAVDKSRNSSIRDGGESIRDGRRSTSNSSSSRSSQKSRSGNGTSVKSSEHGSTRGTINGGGDYI